MLTSESLAAYNIKFDKYFFACKTWPHDKIRKLVQKMCNFEVFLSIAKHCKALLIFAGVLK